MAIATVGLMAAGGVYPVEISLSPVETPDGLLVTAAHRDVTERKMVDLADKITAP